MKRTSLFIVGMLVGTSIGLGVTTMITETTTAKAAGADTYRQLALFGDVFERVRSTYVTEPEDEKLIENASKLLNNYNLNAVIGNIKEHIQDDNLPRGVIVLPDGITKILKNNLLVCSIVL